MKEEAELNSQNAVVLNQAMLLVKEHSHRVITVDPSLLTEVAHEGEINPHPTSVVHQALALVL